MTKFITAFLKWTNHTKEPKKKISSIEENFVKVHISRLKPKFRIYSRYFTFKVENSMFKVKISEFINFTNHAILE